MNRTLKQKDARANSFNVSAKSSELSLPGVALSVCDKNLSMSTPIYAATGKFAGVFNPAKQTFYGRLSEEYVLQKTPAIAFDVAVVEKLACCDRCTLEVAMPDGTVLRAPFERLIRSGFTFDHKGVELP